MRLWPKCLTYGNWGGPGWSGGQFVSDPKKTNWDIPAVDEMDLVFKWHDYSYQHSYSKLNADLRLIDELWSCSVKGVYSECYRISAMILFSLISLLRICFLPITVLLGP